MSEYSNFLTGEITVWGVTVQNWMLLATMVFIISITALRKTL
jgi:hypothetical protein